MRITYFLLNIFSRHIPFVIKNGYKTNHLVQTLIYPMPKMKLQIYNYDEKKPVIGYQAAVGYRPYV